jgi:uncharacterized damage-inducible protein DinB
LFDTFSRVRYQCIELIDSISGDKLDIIPDGFRNNVLWNAGHLVTVQASLLYTRVGRPSPLDTRYVRFFAKGSSPDDFDNELPPFDEVRQLLEKLIGVTQSDIPELEELAYLEPVTVSVGKMILKSFRDALSFLPLHETYHLGMMTAMKKLLQVN